DQQQLLCLISRSINVLGCSARSKSPFVQLLRQLQTLTAVFGSEGSNCRSFLSQKRPKGLRKGDRHRVEKTPQKRLRLWMRVSEEYAGVSHVESLREISQSSPGLNRCQT
ncbi:hypothetical protein FOC4_g10004594, partial [Fusarium odoratissimum]